MGVSCDLKVVLLGSAYVGKTSLVRRLVENTFKITNKYCNTIGAAFIAKRITVSSGNTLCLGIWDTAGEERFESVSRTFYRGSNAAVICYDVTYAKSWDRAKRWISELRHHEEDCKIYMCATKVDLLKDALYERAIPKEKVNLYATGVNIKYFETSSKTGENIDQLFTVVAEDFANDQVLPITSMVNLTGTRRKKSCC